MAGNSPGGGILAERLVDFLSRQRGTCATVTLRKLGIRRTGDAARAMSSLHELLFTMYYVIDRLGRLWRLVEVERKGGFRSREYGGEGRVRLLAYKIVYRYIRGDWS